MIVGGVFTFTRNVSVRYTVTVSTRRATSPPSLVIGMRRVDVGRVRVVSCDNTTEAPRLPIPTAPARDFAEIRIVILLRFRPRLAPADDNRAEKYVPRTTIQRRGTFDVLKHTACRKASSESEGRVGR